MTLPKAKDRLGLVRIIKPTWDLYSSKIKETIGDDRIQDVRTATQGDRYLAAVDLIMVHPQFDEVEAGPDTSIPRYDFSLSENPFEFRILGRIGL